MTSEIVASLVGLGVVVVLILGLVVSVILRRLAERSRMQRALEASIRRDAMRKTEMPRPRVRAGTARADDWRYAGSGRDHFPKQE